MITTGLERRVRETAAPQNWPEILGLDLIRGISSIPVGHFSCCNDALDPRRLGAC